MTSQTTDRSAEGTTGDRKPLSRKQRIFGLVAFLMVVTCVVAVLKYTSDQSSLNNQRTAAAQKQYPDVDVRLSSYLATMGIDITKPLPVKVGKPVPIGIQSIKGGGFTIIGIGPTKISGNTTVLPYYAVSAIINQQPFTLYLPQGKVKVSAAGSQPMLFFDNPVVSTQYTYVDCSTNFWHWSKFTCSHTTDPLLDTYTLSGYQKEGLVTALSHHIRYVTAPAAMITP